MGSVIPGDWTHRRGDRGGTRAVAADVGDLKPAVAWSWRPDHGGRVDQVRVVGQTVIVATMMPRDPSAPHWEHAVVFLLEARTGRELVRRTLPDPVPVAAMAVEGGVAHVIATRRGEPIFWYALSATELVPRHRRIVSTGDGWRGQDALDAWATEDGDLWLELDSLAAAGEACSHAYAFAGREGQPAVVQMMERHPPNDDAPLARDACWLEGDLFVPVAGLWSDEADAFPPTMSRLGAPPASASGVEAWARAKLLGARAQIHVLGNDDSVCAIAAAEEAGRPDRGFVEAFTVDRRSGEAMWRAQTDRVVVRSGLGNAARVARRPNGELLFQSLSIDGDPCTPLLCARPDGQIDELVLGARGRHVLDAALGDLVLSHREDRDGRVEVCGFGIDHEGRLLGRRAVVRWAVDAGNLGGETTVYAGADSIVVRGAREVCGLRVD